MSDHTPSDNLANQRLHRAQLDVAALAADRLGRRQGLGAPVRRAFVLRGQSDGSSPLAELMSGRAARGSGGGGRGGKTRVLLLMSLIWVSVAAPYNTRRPARWWAELLGVADPDDKGARLIRNTLQELERRGFIHVERERGAELPSVILLNETSQGGAYHPPGVRLDDPSDSRGYFRIPDSFWTEGLCTRVTGPALAMYLIALSSSWKGHRRFWFSADLFRETYGLSESTKKKGLRDLVELGVLLEDVRSIDASGGDAGRRFTRKVYRISALYRGQAVVSQDEDEESGLGLVNASGQPVPLASPEQ